MSLIKCPKCGEMYSDSYKKCPFCTEDAEFYGTGKKAKKHGRRVEKPKSPSIMGPALIVIAVVLVGFLAYGFIFKPMTADPNPEVPEEHPGIVTPEEDDKQPEEEKEPEKEPEKEEEPEKEPEPEEEKEPEPVLAEIKLNKKSLKLERGKTFKLKATGAENYQWSSSNKKIVSVDENGKITAKKAGTATITVTAKDATSAACEVTVKEAKKNIQVVLEYGVALSGGNEFSMNEGDVVDLKVTGTDEKAHWEVVKGQNHITVDQDGVVECVKGDGECKLRVTVDDKKIDIRVLCW